MKNLKITLLLVIALGPLCGTCFAQLEKVFDWQPGTDETVRLDPANYHSGRAYQPSFDGGKIHVVIKAQMPVTVFVTYTDAWTQALQHPESVPNVTQICAQEHVLELTYVCALPPSATTLVIRDERNNPDVAVFAGLGAVLGRNEKANEAIEAGVATLLTGQGSATRKFFAPNDVQIEYYRWVCVQNCIQPEFQWLRQIKEKYELTGLLKVYGGFAPDHDKDQVSIRVNSPVPMIVAMLPSRVADQLYSKPEALGSALENTPCQQRGVQKLAFQCAFNMSDGPQSLVVVPETPSNLPRKKAEVEMQAVKCVANCQLIPETGKPGTLAEAPNNN